MAHRKEDEPGFERFEQFLKEWSRRDFLRRMGATAAFSAFAAGGMEWLEACGGGSGGGGTSQNVKKGGHVVEAVISDIKTLNPVLNSDTASSEVIGMIYDGLLSSRPNGDLFPLLASEMPKTSSDNLTYTLTLRDNAKFSDGSPITADDVKFTYDLMFDPSYKAVNSPRRGELTKYVESITAKDKKTIEFKLKSVYAPFASAHLQYGILPKAKWGSLAPAEVNSTDMNTNPTVTSGAWTFGSWQKGQQVTLKANKSYYGGAPYLDTYVYKVVSDGVAAANQLKNGEVDFASVDPSQLSSVQADTSINVITFPVAIFTFYAYNQNPGTLGAKLFTDKTVRQALLYALDRQGMADAIYFKQAVVANSVEAPVGWAYDPNTKPTYPHDPAKANSLLDAAGWAKGADGIRAKGGQKLAFTIITNAGNKQREDLVVAMQQQWKQIGVECTPKLIQFPELVAQITNTRSFDIFLVGFSWGQDPDQSQLWASRNTAPGGFNGFGFKNTQVDQLLDEAVATLDQSKRKQYYFQFQDLMADLQPAPILVFNKGIWGFSKRMQGYDDKSTGIGTYTQFNYRQWLNKTWVSDGK